MLHWLERQIDPFTSFDETAVPPRTVAGFTWHYLKPIRLWLVVLFFASLAVGAVESSLYVLMGWLVDLLAKSAPARLWSDHGMALAGVNRRRTLGLTQI
ncbi:MAG: hypothetical protein NVSMB62_25290 [Acidobacteriaceae bacterium]